MTVVMVKCPTCGSINAKGTDRIAGCYDCGGTWLRHTCVICGQEFAQGITIEPHKDGYAHPECVEGERTGRPVPIDYGD